jgi:prepilin-type N-terminal cleavage/methylation domain-containing protein
MDIKSKNQGFTIVELLIVVVVIAILAAITIVSYNGITNRANQSASKSTAATVQKKTELYYSEESSYPSAANLTGAAASEPYSGIAASTLGTPTADNGKTTVAYTPCGSAPYTGATIDYWHYGATGGTASPAPNAATMYRITLGTGC